MDTGSTAYILLCAGLIFIMTPALGFFYGGLGRRKNVINTMMNSVVLMGIGMVLWVLVGYSLAFGGEGYIIGGFDKVLLLGVTKDSTIGKIAEFAFIAFQMMFAVITPAIITGSTAGRMRFKAVVIFVILWSLIVYYPLAHMVWGAGGLLGEGWLHSIDFGGGNVIHVASGVSGLVVCLFLGERHNFREYSYRTHNIPFVLLGVGLLWLGWFAFNSGNAMAANGLAAHAFMTTGVAGAMGMVSWLLMDVIFTGKPTLIGACTGVIAGLVGITPGAGYVPLWAALVIGALTSPVCYGGIILVKRILKIDDALDAFGCHGIGGIFGGLMVGLFADPSVNGSAGLFFGNPTLLGRQALAALASIVIAVLGSIFCIAIVRLFTPLRVEKRSELIGLDISEHGEIAYPSFNGLD